MNQDAAIAHTMQETLPVENSGLPSLNLDTMQGTRLSTDWITRKLMGDVLMAEYVDENEHGEVKRDGIWLKQDITHKLWRVAKVLMKGPKCSNNIQIGDLVRFPGDRGIPMISTGGKKYIYLNEERVFDVVDYPQETMDESDNQGFVYKAI